MPYAALGDLASPFYLYDLASVRAAYGRLRDALPQRAVLYYSLKANPHPDILAELRSCGARAEVCSAGELDAALAGGWQPDQILYTGPGKRREEVLGALARGVRVFSVDSPLGIDQLDAAAAQWNVTARCVIRINDDQPVAGLGLAMAGVPSQFGADASWVLSDPGRFADRRNAIVCGMHLYMGTNICDQDDLVAQFERSARTSARLAAVLGQHGVRVSLLDLGGGFGAPFARPGRPVTLDGLRARLTALLDRHWPGWRHGEPAVAFESGRYIAGPAGTLVCTVLDVKMSQGMRVIVLDSGINHLGGMSGLRRLPPLVPSLIPAGRDPEVAGHANAVDHETDAIVAGPLCTPLDTWARGVRLPRLEPGDRVAIPNVGAYGLYASLVAFLGHPLPAEVVVDSAWRPGPRHVSSLGLSRHARRGGPDHG